MGGSERIQASNDEATKLLAVNSDKRLHRLEGQLEKIDGHFVKLGATILDQQNLNHRHHEDIIQHMDDQTSQKQEMKQHTTSLEKIAAQQISTKTEVMRM